MEQIENIYKKLTNVDIQQQQALWDERGKGYYGEFLVFKELYPQLPGNCKILMNINIPVTPYKTTEIDLLLLHETGAYVFEMKHYKGTIYGKPTDSHWTQYFRTAANNVFRNPIDQNLYHIHALRRRYPDLPIHSFIVFTSPDCDLKVECLEKDITVCCFSALMGHIRTLTNHPPVMDMIQIDRIFLDLMQFSPVMQQPTASETTSPVPFHEYASALAEQYKESLAQYEDTYQMNVRNLKAACDSEVRHAQSQAETDVHQARASSRRATVIALLVCIASIVCAVILCIGYQKVCNIQVNNAQTELAKFAQKFERVDDFEVGDITMTKDFISVTDLTLSTSTDVEHACNFGFSLKWNGQYHGASITRNTAVIVMLKDGSINEYRLPDNFFPISHSKRLLLGDANAIYGVYNSAQFPIHRLLDTDIEDISYIKLAPIDIWVLENNEPRTISTGYEIEIYDCANPDG